MGRMPTHKKKNRRFFLAPENFINFDNHERNNSLVIQPVAYVSDQAPGGRPSSNSCFFLIRGKMSIGGIYDPEADMHTVAVTVSPRSAEVKAPTCLFPLRAMTLD